MSIQGIIESLLEREIGLSAEAIGIKTIAKAISHRVHACGFEEKAYLNHLRSSEKELENLIEMAVIPETWFFRNRESFAFLARYVRTQWLTENKENELRILSIPCSTGEEPYSIAMTLIDTGLFSEIGKNRFYIEATDISNNALRKARLGIYGRESFRGTNLSFRKRHFDQIADPREENQNYKWQINATVRNMIRFRKGNLVDRRGFPSDDKLFHIIFCRNLLIYLSESGKQRALENIENMLTKDGVLFLGHVERSFVCGSARKDQFSWIRRPGVFACQRTDPDRMKKVPKPVSGFHKLGKPEKGPSPTDLEKEAYKIHLYNLEKSGLLHHQTREIAGQKPENQQLNDASGRQAFFGTAEKKKPQKSTFSETTTHDQDAHADNLLCLAQKLADQGNLHEAMKMCETYLADNAFHIQAHFLMGLICHALDDEERAEASFNKAVYLDPNHHEALSHLAFIMEHRGDKIKAVQLRQRAYRILQRNESK